MSLPEKPWKAMYRALLGRVTELIEDGEGWTGIEHPSITELRRVVAFHNELWEDHEGGPTRLVDMPELTGEAPG